MQKPYLGHQGLVLPSPDHLQYSILVNNVNMYSVLFVFLEWTIFVDHIIATKQ